MSKVPLTKEGEIILKERLTKLKFVDRPVNDQVCLVINTTEGRQSIKDSASIRQTALRKKILCTTTMFGADALVKALENKEEDWEFSSLQEIN